MTPRKLWRSRTNQQTTSTNRNDDRSIFKSLFEEKRTKKKHQHQVFSFRLPDFFQLLLVFYFFFFFLFSNSSLLFVPICEFLLDFVQFLFCFFFIFIYIYLLFRSFRVARYAGSSEYLRRFLFQMNNASSERSSTQINNKSNILFVFFFYFDCCWGFFLCIILFCRDMNHLFTVLNTEIFLLNSSLYFYSSRKVFFLLLFLLFFYCRSRKIFQFSFTTTIDWIDWWCLINIYVHFVHTQNRC